MKTLFYRVNHNQWQPQEVARGPFDGLQGGALAALMCAAVEEQIAGDAEVVIVNAHYLRPTPLAAVEVAVKPIQVGGRVALYHVELAAEGKLRAQSVITVMRPQAIPGLAEPRQVSNRPWQGVSRPGPDVHGKPWLMDMMEARMDDKGVPWFRFDLPVTGSESRFARALCAADWIAGLTRADTWQDPIVAAAPNIDLTARKLRTPREDWTGVRATGTWTPTGRGIAQGEMLDVDGVFGTVSCTVALVPKIQAVLTPA